MKRFDSNKEMVRSIKEGPEQGRSIHYRYLYKTAIKRSSNLYLQLDHSSSCPEHQLETHKGLTTLCMEIDNRVKLATAKGKISCGRQRKIRPEVSDLSRVGETITGTYLDSSSKELWSSVCSWKATANTMAHALKWHRSFLHQHSPLWGASASRGKGWANKYKIFRISALETWGKTLHLLRQWQTLSRGDLAHTWLLT